MNNFLELLEQDEEDELHQLEMEVPRETRQLWDRSNPLVEYNEKIFKAHFRFTKVNFLKVVDLLTPHLPDFENNRGSPLTPLQRTSLGLSFMAGATFQRVAGYLAGVKLTCAHHTVHQFLTAVCQISANIITMPTEHEMQKTSDYFEDKYGIAGMGFGVDGTLVRLGVQPSAHLLPEGLIPQDFWCRKMFYALNVLIAGDHRRLVRNVIATFAGSTHDARAWRSSAMKAYIEAQRRFYGVADSPYPISRTLMKPFPQNELTQRKRAFNKALCAARTEMTEDLIGILKQRYPCLRLGLRMKPERCSMAVIAACTLHNLSILFDDPQP